jgi:UPF0755 protein
MKIKRIIVGGLLALTVIVAVSFLVVWHYWSHSPFEISETTYVYVRPDDTEDDILQQLRESVHANTLTGWKLARMAMDFKPHTGRYAIEPGQSFVSLYRNLLRGHQTPVKLTIPSVRTMDRLAGFLGNKLMMDSAEVAQSFADSSFAASYGYTTATLPALFIPNTYEVYWDTTLPKFMQRMQDENERFWQQQQRDEAAKALAFTREEIVTLASIVDEETANNGEKARVAGLYMNRLKKGIPLQADPTVKFAVGDVTLRRIRGEHLKVKSPYNTYLNKGLPPGPIRIPSIAGIDAVLQMEQHPYLYMCAKEDFSGTHNFAATFAEHQQNARRYQKALNERGIR